MGFTNNGAVLNASPLLLDYYQEIARTALQAAIVTGERPAPARYLITFGRGIGKGHIAGITDGYQSVMLPTDDFRLDILDAAGNAFAPTEESQKKLRTNFAVTSALACGAPASIASKWLTRA